MIAGVFRHDEGKDMATSRMNEVIQHLRRTVLLPEGAGLTDGQLLEDFISRRDEKALAVLVRRHAPMVWGVCLRVLRNHHDAEDAFQATFLVFVRKAASLASKELVANWLYGVAHQSALKARATAAKRKERERQVTVMPEPEVAQQVLWTDLQPLLDQELSRLPAKYRSVIVLCDLEGKTRKEAAQELGVPDGTVGGWLARARAMLAKRLAQRGVTLSGAALAAVLSQNVASAGVPTSVVCSTIKTATLFAAGQAAATGVISANVAALTEGVLKAMFLSKVKIACVCVLVVSLFGGGMGLLLSQNLAAQDVNERQSRIAAATFTTTAIPQPVSQQKDAKEENQKDEGQQNQKGKEENQNDDGQKNQKDDGQKNQKDDGEKNQKDDGDKGEVKSVDTTKNTITVLKKVQGKEVTETLAYLNPIVSVGGKAANITDLKAGMPVSLRLSPDKKKVVEIKGSQPK